jgi:hypothetical protein
MKLTIFPSLYDTQITADSTKEVAWQTLAKRLSKPEITTDKNSAKMFSGATFKQDGKRCNDDILEHNLLILDIDDGWHPKLFIEEFSDLEFVLYTSYNHRWNKAEQKLDAEVMKFRVVLPLAKPVSPEHFKNMKTVLLEKFDGIDAASLVPSQAFFLPSCHPDRVQQFKAVHNQGQMFDFDKFQMEMFVQQQKQLFQKKRFDAQRKATQDTTPLNEAVALLKGMSADCGYDVWWKVGACLKTLYGEAGFDVWHRWSAQGATFNSNENKLRSKWRSFSDTSNYSYGYLVNRSRDYPI